MLSVLRVLAPTDRRQLLQNINALRQSLGTLEFTKLQPQPDDSSRHSPVLPRTLESATSGHHSPVLPRTLESATSNSTPPPPSPGSGPQSARHLRRFSAPDGHAIEDPEKAKAVVQSQLRDLYTQLQSLSVWAHEVAGTEMLDDDGGSSASNSMRLVAPAASAPHGLHRASSTGASTPAPSVDSEDAGALRTELRIARAQVAALEHALGNAAAEVRKSDGSPKTASPTQPQQPQPQPKEAEAVLAHCDAVLTQVLKSAESGIVGRKERDLVRSAVSNARQQLRRRSSLSLAPPPGAPGADGTLTPRSEGSAVALSSPGPSPRTPSSIPRPASARAAAAGVAVPPLRVRSSAPKAKEAAAAPAAAPATAASPRASRPSPRGGGGASKEELDALRASLESQAAVNKVLEAELAQRAGGEAALRAEAAELREGLRRATSELLVRREELCTKAEQVALARVRIAELEEELEAARRALRSRRRLRASDASEGDEEGDEAAAPGAAPGTAAPSAAASAPGRTARASSRGSSPASPPTSRPAAPRPGPRPRPPAPASTERAGPPPPPRLPL
eukprot:tig00021720_g23189.t1